MTLDLTWRELTHGAEYRALSAALVANREALRSYLAGNDGTAADLVFQGGGMLGLAHLGALDAIETVGLRPRHVAGTSAGAIMATLLYARLGQLHPGSAAAEIFEDLRCMPAEQFMDGPSCLAALTDSRRRLGRRLIDGLRCLPTIVSALRKSYGLHPGRSFSNWLDSRLARCGIYDLQTLIQDRDGHRLQVVACGLPGGIKFVLPRDLGCFRLDPRRERPSVMARASMAIPLFFAPVQWPVRPAGWADYLDAHAAIFPEWQRLELATAPRLLLFDGGLLSNLPVDILANENADRTPTIAIALQSTRAPPPRIAARRRGSSLLRLLADLLRATRALRDAEARVAAAQQRCFRAIWIDTGDADWLEFSPDRARARDLYCRGMRAVLEALP